MMLSGCFSGIVSMDTNNEEKHVILFQTAEEFHSNVKAKNDFGGKIPIQRHYLLLFRKYYSLANTFPKSLI